MELALQKYLRTHGLEKTVTDFNLVAREYPHKVLIRYNQIESNFTNEEVRESRGIVLERGTWNVMSFAFRKFFNLGEGHAAVMDWASTRIMKKMDGCFSYKASLNLWDGGRISFGKVVKHNKRPILIGMNEMGDIVPSKIITTKDSGTKDNWVDIHFEENIAKCKGECYKMRVTTNHEIFEKHKNYIFASDLKRGDTIFTYDKEICSDTLHLIESALLGDGSISNNGKKGKFGEGHSIKQNQYVEYLNLLLGECATKIDRKRTSGFGSKIIRIASISTPSLKKIYDKWYSSGKKRIPDDLSWINDFSIAKWYMDDGSLAHTDKQKDRAVFATNGFTKREVEVLGKKLTSMYGIDTTVYYSKGWMLRINYSNETINNFWKAIAAWVHPSLNYKLPIKYKNIK